MAENVYDIGIGTAVDNKGLKKDLSTAETQIKKFAGSASKAISGIDFSKLMGPAMAVTAVAGIKQVIGALDQWGTAAREHQATGV
jgi:hypothetical protein